MGEGLRTNKLGFLKNLHGDLRRIEVNNNSGTVVVDTRAVGTSAYSLRAAVAELILSFKTIAMCISMKAGSHPFKLFEDTRMVLDSNNWYGRSAQPLRWPSSRIGGLYLLNSA